MKSLFWTEITWLHRLAAGPKLAAMCLLGSGLVLVGDLRGLAVGCFLTSMAYVSLGRPAVRHLKHLRGAVVAAALVAAFHAALGEPGTGVAGALRLLTAILLATMFTVTTRFDDLLDVLENLLRPLRTLGVPTGRLASRSRWRCVSSTSSMRRGRGRTAPTARAPDAPAAGGCSRR